MASETLPAMIQMLLESVPSPHSFSPQSHDFIPKKSRQSACAGIAGTAIVAVAAIIAMTTRNFLKKFFILKSMFKLI